MPAEAAAAGAPRTAQPRIAAAVPGRAPAPGGPAARAHPARAHPARDARRWGAALVAGWLVLGGLGGVARAEDQGYRYWSFWTWDEGEGRWTYATQGPGTLRASDGDLLGFRFAVSTESTDTDVPRGEHTFAAICGADGERSDRTRVALVIDFGTEADAPGGATPPGPRTECARLEDGSTAAMALAETAGPLRYSSDALLCAIAGYPERGCADQLADGGDPEADEAGTGAGNDSGDGGGSGVAVLAGVGTVVALAVAAALRARRRRG
ncbi:SCO2322 family protein [Streptomyces sp. DSM 44917]|uniref:SCO2322 family protein n=1 Tax=Streptomyces boetiae TaxID=3075541 RepID=A0ABU2L3E3_9ACTN|nr:SCO2322 family protein [Streptomyces sp. DSM 44917]MDT0306084.1 SCO2322 family protein [Streptomyces sp. DSM 44917]